MAVISSLIRAWEVISQGAKQNNFNIIKLLSFLLVCYNTLGGDGMAGVTSKYEINNANKGKREHQKIKPYIVLEYLMRNSDE